MSQRTRAWEFDVDVLRGLLVGFAFERVDVTTYYFEPGGDDESLTVTVGAEW